MENMKLRLLIDELASLMNVPSDKKESIFQRYVDKPDIDVIKELSIIAYRTLRHNQGYYDYALIRIRNYNQSICPSLQEMKKILSNMFENVSEGNMSLEKNHKLVNTEILRFTKLFNEAGIDYYLVGALPCFIKTGIPLFRYHDDIDIMINEDDIEKVHEIINGSGYTFQDDRYPSLERFYETLQNKPPHTVMAQNPNNEFHLGFFTFRREKDSSVTMREYSHRVENGSLIIDVLERRNSVEGTLLRYDETEVEYNGTSFKTGTLENVVHLKQFTRRPKDITDVEKLIQFVNQKKLNQLEFYKNENIILENVNPPIKLQL